MFAAGEVAVMMETISFAFTIGLIKPNRGSTSIGRSKPPVNPHRNKPATTGNDCQVPQARWMTLLRVRKRIS
jgi:hypothetical protein